MTGGRCVVVPRACRQVTTVAQGSARHEQQQVTRCEETYLKMLGGINRSFVEELLRWGGGSVGERRKGDKVEEQRGGKASR